MDQHYTLSTIEVSEWCNRCGKNTPHRVADRRLQYCIPCFDRPVQPELEAAQQTERQGGLFEVTETGV